MIALTLGQAKLIAVLVVIVLLGGALASAWFMKELMQKAALVVILGLLALLLLAGAVMQPQLQAGRLESGRFVLLIDNSASMTATDVEDSPTRPFDASELDDSPFRRPLGAGTLDPLATGVLPLCVGEATKVAGRLTEGDKG
mgnify:CR=1 FL=1